MHIGWNGVFFVLQFNAASNRVHLMNCGFDCCVFFHLFGKLFFDTGVFKCFGNISHSYSFACIVCARNVLPTDGMMGITRRAFNAAQLERHVFAKSNLVWYSAHYASSPNWPNLLYIKHDWLACMQIIASIFMINHFAAQFPRWVEYKN